MTREQRESPGMPFRFDFTVVETRAKMPSKSMSAQRDIPPSAVNRFGGDWTKEKLRVLKQYLEAYARIFAANKKAQFYETFYVDAFAGSGYIRTGGRKKAADQEQELFADIAFYN
jgi:hypothetical protein